MNGCQSPNSKLYLGKKYKKRQSYKHWEKITRGGLISIGKSMHMSDEIKYEFI